jgi:RNA polymerase sigma-70 factor (ECF subfamily)
MPEDNHAQGSADADIRLMIEAAAGSEAAFAELIRRHQNPLVNFFTRLGAYRDAEEWVQETMIRVWKARERYRPTAKFTTFLYTIARNVWADQGRKTMRRERLQASLRGDAAIAPRERPAPAAGLDVQAALDRLSPKLRDVVVLNVYQGLPYEETAAILGIPVGTAKSRMNLALKALREYFDA